METNIFKETIEHLLAGSVIDEFKYKRIYANLINREFLKEINDYLHRLDRRCVKTRDGLGFMLTFTDNQDKLAKQSGRTMLRDYCSKLKPFIEWLKWTSIISDDEVILTTGVELRYDQIHKHLDGNKAMQQTLKDLKDRLGNSNSMDSNDHLKTVLRWFENNGFLVKNDPNGLSYTATAKWSVYEDVIEFIATKIGLDREADYEQENLF